MVLYLGRAWVAPKTAKTTGTISLPIASLSPWAPYLSVPGSEVGVIGQLGRNTGLGDRHSDSHPDSVIIS